MNRKALITSLSGYHLSKKEILLLRKYKPWGIILFKRNIKNYKQIKSLVKKIRYEVKDNKYPILIDEEGGTVSRLSNLIDNTHFSQKFFGEIRDSNVFNDSSLYEIFVKNWDGHRNTESEIHYAYILKSLILLSVLVYFKNFFSKKTSPGLDLAIYFFIILIISGLLFYLSYKLFPFFFPEILIKALPSRFLMIYSFLGWPVIISMTYIFFLKKFLSKKKLITTFFYILLIFPVIQKEERVINTLKYFYLSEKKEKNVFFEKLKNIDTKNHILSTTSLNYSILRQSNKPFLFDTNSFDFLPYHPYLIDDIDLIFKEIYEIDLRVKPKIKNSYVSDNYIKTIFQKKDLNEWKVIFNNHKIDYLVVPSDWVINLSLVLKNNGISLYKI